MLQPPYEGGRPGAASVNQLQRCCFLVWFLSIFISLPLGVTTATAPFHPSANAPVFHQDTNASSDFILPRSAPHCPDMLCVCNETAADIGLSNIFCDARNLTAVPVILTLEVHILNLSANSIQSVSSQPFSFLEYLQLLHLGHNQISEILYGSFHNLSTLKELYLQHNHLRILDPDIFVNLFKLEILDLSHNNVKSLPSGLFHFTRQLRHLDLSYNMLNALNPDALNRFHKLNIPDAPNDIPPRSVVIDDLPEVHRLNLSGNTLQQVPLECLTLTLVQLKVLDLRRNPLNCSSCALIYGLRHIDMIQNFTLYLPLCAFPAALVGSSPTSQETGQELGCNNVSVSQHSSLCPIAGQNGSQIQRPLLASTEVLKTSPRPTPLPYDPMLGWYTAAVLAGMLVLFLICLGLEKIKVRIMFGLHQRRMRRDQLKYMVVTTTVHEEPPPTVCTEGSESRVKFTIGKGDSDLNKSDGPSESESSKEHENSSQQAATSNSVTCPQPFVQFVVDLVPPDDNPTENSLTGTEQKHPVNPANDTSQQEAINKLSEKIPNMDHIKQASQNQDLNVQGEVTRADRQDNGCQGNHTPKPATCTSDDSTVKQAEQKETDFWTIWNEVNRTTRDSVVQVHPKCPVHNPHVAKRIQKLMVTKNKSLHSLLEDESFC